MRLHDRPDDTVQVGHESLAVFGDVEGLGLRPRLVGAARGEEVEGVVAPGGEQDRGAHLAGAAAIGQFVGQADELVDKVEELGRLGDKIGAVVETIDDIARRDQGDTRQTGSGCRTDRTAERCVEGIQA